jgi:hypothetical protein
MYCGVTLGGALPAAVSVWLVPRYGWEMIFLIGGVMPLALAACAWLWLPESVKFLVVKGRRDEAARVLRIVAADTDIGPHTMLVPPAETVYGGFNPKYLFAEGLAFLTPLLWLCFAINLMGLNFLIAWMPTLLIGQKLLAQSDAAIVTSLVQIGGTIGGLVLCRPMERRGFWPVALLSAGAVAVRRAHRLRGGDLDLAADTGGNPRGLLHSWPAVRAQCRIRDDLSDHGALERFRLGVRRRTLRLDPRAYFRQQADCAGAVGADGLSPRRRPVRRRRWPASRSRCCTRRRSGVRGSASAIRRQARSARPRDVGTIGSVHHAAQRTAVIPQAMRYDLCSAERGRGAWHTLRWISRKPEAGA